MWQHYPFLALICSLDYVASQTVHVNVSDLGCSVCREPDEDNVLTFANPADMPPNSGLWGIELTRPFLSRIYRTMGQTWQARTVSTLDKENTEHHILLPFMINSGGESVMVGEAAIAVLTRYGATPLSLGSSRFCHVKVPLPIKAHDCVVQWGKPSSPTAVNHDHDHDIRE